MSLGSTVAALRTPEELYALLDPDVMWYSADVDSSCTCNGMDDVIACVERSVARGLDGRFELLRETDDSVLVRPVFDPPRDGSEMCLLLRFREGSIVEMRDFSSTDRALGYAGAL